jgi:hypothetical protein|nr:MAG TPA: DNA REPAIR HELICASE RAD25, SSL2, PRE-INITIATION COMPLEX, RNA POLYMERASE.0A [Caudoviricetes sp.]
MSDYISRDKIFSVWRSMPKPASISSLTDAINRTPAADVEPVRHGNWNIRLSDESTLCLECSVCGRRVVNTDLRHLLELGEYGEACRGYPYCHCGAKMDLEELK